MAAHDGQFRKGGDEAVPYFTHPAHVGIMLARWGLEEHLIVAGILHDAVEDCDDWTIERVEVEFGHHVAQIVGQLTEDKSKTWAERKQWAVDHVPHMSPEAATVKAADKIHNLQSLLADLRDVDDHESVWSRFKGGREGTLRMDGALVEALCGRAAPDLGRALRAAYEAVVAESDREKRPEVASGS
jgi:(p)ppGpp synthase/HD superfamily hydrolase